VVLAGHAKFKFPVCPNPSRKSLGLKNLRDWQRCADLFVELFDEMRGERGRFPLLILMDEEKELLQAGPFPFGDAPDLFIKTRAIGFGLVCADPAYERRRGRQTHVHQVATTRRIDKDICDAARFKQIIEFG
jgi:hypothetical protein